jgi:hypothetical protein
MKTLGATIIVLVLLAVMFWGFFYYSIHLAKESIVLPDETSGTAASSPITGSVINPLQAINPSTSVPIEFHGPTGPPHIIGPSGPPPNY